MQTLNLSARGPSPPRATAWAPHHAENTPQLKMQWFFVQTTGKSTLKKCSDEEMSKIIELFCCSSSCEPCTRKQLPYKLFPTFQKTRCYKRNKSIDLKESVFFYIYIMKPLHGTSKKILVEIVPVVLWMFNFLLYVDVFRSASLNKKYPWIDLQPK